MNVIRRIASTHVATLACLIMLPLMCATLQSACTRNDRVSTISATIGAVNAARSGFQAWDLSHQRELASKATTREEAERDLATYRATTQHAIVEGFTVAYQTLAVAATQTDHLSLTAALAAFEDLKNTICPLIGNGCSFLAPSPTPTINRRE